MSICGLSCKIIVSIIVIVLKDFYMTISCVYFICDNKMEIIVIWFGLINIDYIIKNPLKLFIFHILYLSFICNPKLKIS